MRTQLGVPAVAGAAELGAAASVLRSDPSTLHFELLPDVGMLAQAFSKHVLLLRG